MRTIIKCTHLGMMSNKNSELIDKILHFAKEYSHISADRILLGCNSIPNELKKDIAIQIEANKKIENKIPSWSGFRVYIPEKINLEQASSELTAKYKIKYIQDNDVIVDLTSGLGVDLFFMSYKAKLGIHIEKNSDLSESAKYNYCRLLGEGAYDDKFVFITEDYLNAIEKVIKNYSPNIVYIDPARRSIDNNEKRLYSIEDCQPNILTVIAEIDQLSEIYNNKIDRYIIKISPMFDIIELTKKIKNISNIDIISVKGEVKEILLNILPKYTNEALISSVNIISDDNTIVYSSYLDKGKTINIELSSPFQYIYEMNSATLKSGLYKSVALDFDLKLISHESKLFTSDKIEEGFPGKIMKLEGVLPFSKNSIKLIKKKYCEAQIRTRCFPITSESLRSRLSLSESESLRIIGTKDKDGNNILLLCQIMS